MFMRLRCASPFSCCCGDVGIHIHLHVWTMSAHATARAMNAGRERRVSDDCPGYGYLFGVDYRAAQHLTMGFWLSLGGSGVSLMTRCAELKLVMERKRYEQAADRARGG